MSVAKLSSITAQDVRLLIMGNIQAGLGDVSAVAKITEIFKKVIAHDRIAVAIPSEERHRFALFSPSFEGVRSIIVDDCSIRHQKINLKDSKLIDEFGPTHIVAFHIKEPLQFIDGRDPIPTVCFEEYGVRFGDPLINFKKHKMIKYSMGIGYGEKPSFHDIGIFQMQDLKEYFSDFEGQEAVMKMKKYLPSLSPYLYFNLMNKKQTDPLDIDWFAANNSIFFAYLYMSGKTSLVRSYIGAMILLEESRSSSHKNMVFILPGLGVNPKTLLDREFTQLLAKHGFSHVHTVELKDNESEPLRNTISLECPSGQKAQSRNLKLVSGSLSHSDFIASLKISEDEVCGTGDQSISEQLVMGKKIYYQMLPHKKDFSDSLQNMILRVTGVYVNFSSPYVYDSSSSTIDKIGLMYEHFLKLQTPHWSEVIRQIHLSQNCEERMQRAVLSYPELALTL